MAKESKSKKKEGLEGEKISFSSFFASKLQEDKKLKKYQRRELEIFLKKQGLNEIEDLKKFEEAYKKF